MGWNVAVAGVTGAVGQEFLSIIEERKFPFSSLKVLASSRSAGKKIPFMGKEYAVEQMTTDSFKGINLALFSAGASRSREFAPAAVKAGAVVVDNSSAYPHGPPGAAGRARDQPAEDQRAQRHYRQSRTARRLSGSCRSGRCTRSIRSREWS